MGICKLRQYCLGIAVLAALVTHSFASEYSGSGDWSAANWGGVEPTGATTAFIRTGAQVVTVTRPGELAHRLTLGQSASQSILTIASGSLNLVGAGSEPSGGHLYVAWQGDGETTGIVNLKGGALTVKGYATGTNSAGDRAQLNVSGNGAFHVNGGLSVGGGHASAEDRVHITGSRARVEVAKYATFRAHSTLKFTLDMYGASTLNANSFTAEPNAKLVIDFGTYVYSGSGTDVIRLVDAAIFKTPFEATNISYLNSAELSYELTQDPDDAGGIYVSIPEPSTCAWFAGLLTLGYGIARRR